MYTYSYAPGAQTSQPSDPLSVYAYLMPTLFLIPVHCITTGGHQIIWLKVVSPRVLARANFASY